MKRNPELRYSEKIECDGAIVENVWCPPLHPVSNHKEPKNLQVVIGCTANCGWFSLKRCVLEILDTTTPLSEAAYEQGSRNSGYSVNIPLCKVSAQQQRHIYLRRFVYSNCDIKPGDYQMTMHRFGHFILFPRQFHVIRNLKTS